MPETPSLLTSCAICLRLHAPVDPAHANPVCPRCAHRPLRDAGSHDPPRGPTGAAGD